MVKGTWIASPKITKRLFEMMDEVGEFKMTMDKLLESVTSGWSWYADYGGECRALQATLGAPKPSLCARLVRKQLAPSTVKKSRLPKEWSGHKFTDDELAKPLAGEEVSFAAKSKRGKDYTAVGKLAKQTYKGSTFYALNWTQTSEIGLH